MVRFFVEIKFYSFAIFLSNQLWILIFLNEMSTRPTLRVNIFIQDRRETFFSVSARIVTGCEICSIPKQ